MHVKASQPSAALVVVVQPRPMWLQVGNAGCGCSRRWSRRWRCARLWLCDWEWDCECMCVCVLCCCMMCLSVVRGMQNMCESNVIKMLKRRDAMPKSKQKSAATTATGTTR